MEALESVSNSRPLGGEIRAKCRGDLIIVNLPLSSFWSAQAHLITVDWKLKQHSRFRTKPFRRFAPDWK